MLRVPVSLNCPPALRIIPRAATESTEASLRSEPEWQKRQLPRGAGAAFTLKNTWRPRSAASDSGRSPGSRRNRSKGVSSETSVASYIWTASPKKSEKLYSMRRELVGGRVAVAPVDDRRRAVRGHADELGRRPTTGG